LLAALGWLTYANWKLEKTQELAHATACGTHGCPDSQPIQVSRDPFAHRYAWRLGAGERAVTCRRRLVLVGDWRCTLDEETLPGVEGRDDLTHYPHQTKRGVD
jgi:hypothetical protein